MPHLTIHVLDTSSGKPAVAMRVVLRRAETQAVLAGAVTNADGRLDKPLLEGSAFVPASYEISFHVGDYFRSQGAALPEPSFLNVVPVRFSAAAGGDYHVPLLVSPYGYSTYRGS
jgi:5-hydroxyisourate hydrolase